jgi:hypothetical protein
MVRKKMIDKKNILECLKNILIKFETAKLLIRDGKEIPAYEKMQGIGDNINKLAQYIEKDINEDDTN